MVDEAKVLLITKKRPAWQLNRMNGIGGSINAGEQPIDAMRREFKEETGLQVDEWEHTVHYSGKDFEIFIFKTTGDVYAARTTTDENICVVNRTALPNSCLYNLNWMIALSCDPSVKYPVTVEER